MSMKNKRSSLSWSKRLLLAVAVVLGVSVGSAKSADAAQYVVYIHGKSMTTWPSAAWMKTSSAWTHKSLSFNGSSRLTDSTATGAIKTALDAYCKTTDCVLACYSAGCARMLYTLNLYKTTTYRILWTSALASAAGGSELANLSTNKGVKLLAKLFLANPPPSGAIDQDLTPSNLRSGTLAPIQLAARSTIYHIAGSKDICLRLNVLAQLVTAGVSGVMSAISNVIFAISGPVGWIKIGISIITGFFKAKSAKICGNSKLPGGKGDGIVPVHSAAGYSDTIQHTSHADGGPKYVLRAYEQSALFASDHRGIFKDFVVKASLRMGVSGTATCANMPTPPTDPDASIVYEDADGSPRYESTTNHALMMCGVNALTDPAMYGSCIGTNGCCDNFSDGPTTGCTCGEALCIQSGQETYSYFTAYGCAGIEYADAGPAIGGTWDGMGMVGLAATTKTMKSRRRNYDGVCEDATEHWKGSGGATCEYQPASKSVSGRRVYRVNIDTTDYRASSASSWPGWVVMTRTFSLCP